jgi:hypothetical protein
MPNLGDENIISASFKDLEATSIILLLLPQIIINGRSS